MPWGQPMSVGIPYSWVLRECAGAEAQGVRRDSLFAESLIVPQYCDDRDQISAAQYVLLWMNIGRSVEDAAHGLGRIRLRLGYSALALRVMLGCATLEGALRAVQKFYGLVGSTVQLNLAVDQDHALVSVRCESRVAAAETVMEDTGLSWLFICCTYFLGRPLQVIDVITRDPTHFNLGQRHWAAKALVRHGDCSALRFSRALLACPGAERTSDDVFWECFRTWLPFVEYGHTASWPVATDANVSALRLQDIAKQAEVSVSTLRRRLEQTQGSFRLARRHALADAGIAMLMGSERSVEDIAEQLGYADARSFRRFLKGATGRSPRDFRGAEATSAGGLPANSSIHNRIRELATLLDN